MAATTLSVRSRDVYGRPKSTLIRFADTATLAQIQTYFTNYAPLQKAIQAPAIETAEVTFSLTVPGGVGTPGADINGQEGARFSFANASLNRWGIWIPGILPTYKVGLKDIDIAPQPMIDWLAYIHTGDGTIAPVNEASQDVGALVRAIQSHNK
jgi:hypothetical protein